MVFLWGDQRPGLDTLYVRQRGRALEADGWSRPAVAGAPCGVLTFDRTMPIWLGHAHGTQRFGGRLRNVVLENL